jgi:hypothetical protein
MGKESLLGPRLFFITPPAAKGRIEFIFLQTVK